MNTSSESSITQSAGRWLTSDGRILFATRCARLFAYGLLSVVLVLYLSEIDLDGEQIGVLLTLTLLGDASASLWITTHADRWGRRKMLLVGASLMLLAAVLFASTTNFWILLLAATIGVISPSGNEVGPFLSIEQAALTEIVSSRSRTSVFAWYNLVGSFATATGALCGGLISEGLIDSGWSEADSYRPVIYLYGVVGLILAAAFLRLSPAIEPAEQVADVEPTGPKPSKLGLTHSRGVVFQLAALFALDSFGGGFVIQSILAYWFHARFGAEPAMIGAIFFGANLFAGFSSLLAAWVSNRIGLINTMVFTHLPSNVLLLLVPLMPTVEWAIAVLLLRFSISQMDVPTRQSYTMAVVRPEERSAAAGITGVARSIGSAISPMFAAMMIESASLASVPFFLAGGVKILYDVILYRQFQRLKPIEETNSSLKP